MRRFVISLIFFSALGLALFAEQPFFLQDWLIPRDFEWGRDQHLPPMVGKTYNYDMSSDTCYITFNSKDKSHVDFPPYFIKNNLLGWDKTYEEIISAFEGNELFFIYEYVHPLAHKENFSDGIEFLDIIRITCRENNYFELELYFPHVRTLEERKEEKPTYCYLYYQKKGLDSYNTHVPQREVFENKYRSIWENNSQEEKIINALSYFLAFNNGCIPALFDCSKTFDNANTDVKNILRTKFEVSITNKKELISYVQNPLQTSIFQNYLAAVELIESYPDKEIVKIGEENNYSIGGISRLFFTDAMKEHLGKHGLESFLQTEVLFVLRLGVGAGYISKEEALYYGMPVANQLLQNYNSFEDYAADFAACKSFIGLPKLNHASSPADVMIQYNNAVKYFPVEEIHFTAEDADEPLSFYDAYYKPAGDALLWCQVQSESNNLDGKNLSAVKQIVSKYGKPACIKTLLNKIKPVKYDSSSGMKMTVFYNNNYSKLWKGLPENERYAIAFSSNLFELNRQYHLDFDNLVKLSDKSADSKKLLKNSWGIESYDDLIEMYQSLEESGQSGSYQALSDLLNKYPDKSPAQIAAYENLSMLDTSRLFFVNETRDRLGEHGIEAWDQGREITILRWGISSDYISREEAMSLIEPVEEKILQNYYSFEDYISHYIIGRQFYGLTDGTYEALGQAAKEASLNARAYIPFEYLDFPAENIGSSKVMSYNDCLFIPSEDFKKWEKFYDLYRKKSTEKTIAELEELEKEIPEFQNVVYYWHLKLLDTFAKKDELADFIEKNQDFLNTLPKDCEVYVNSMFKYLSALIYTFNPEKCLSAFEKLPDNLRKNVHFYYHYACANYYMMNLAASQKEFDFYKKKAAYAFSVLKQSDFELPETFDSWLKFAEGK